MKVYILNQNLNEFPRIMGFYSNLKHAKSNLSKIRRKVRKEWKKETGEKSCYDGLNIVSIEIPINKQSIINSLNSFLYYEILHRENNNKRL